METKPFIELDENKEIEKENSGKNNDSPKNNDTIPIRRIRQPFSLKGGKEPLSLYTRRIIDPDKISKLLLENSSHGICGSYNLGNTCFMNSSIACLSNCTELTYFFVSGEYKKEINTQNNLGTKGALSESWGKLMKQYWISDSTVGDPSDFKEKFGYKIKRFSGFNQQDSNEFIDLFLDILNEDLNFVNKKEYLELKEKSDNETEEQCSKRFWNNYLNRNDSIVTDLFWGQIKSTITCPDCGYINITFDPFNTLNLNIPHLCDNNFFSYEVISCFQIFYVPKYNLRTPIKIKCFNILKNAKFKDWFNCLKSDNNFSFHDDININKMILTEISDKKLIKIYDESCDKNFINFNEEYYFTYEIMNDDENKYIPIYFKEKSGFSVFPRIIMVSETNSTFDDFRKKIYFNLRKLIYSPFKKYNEYCDDLSNKIKEYINDFKIKDEIIFDLINKEYNKIFNNDNDDIKDVLNDFISDMPFKLYLTDKIGNNVDEDIINSDKVDIINNNNFKTLSEEFSKLTKISSPSDSLLKLIYLLEKENYFLVLEFNNNSNYIHKNLFKLNNCKRHELNFKKENQNNKDDKFKYKNITLNDCLKSFSREEKLKPGDEWNCPKCKNNVLPYKKMELYYTPKILIICFKRFIKGNYFWNKNDENIYFPIDNLNLNEFHVGKDKNNSVYDLFAVSQHYGGTGFGHYTAVCKNLGKWYSYNDSSVHEIDKREINSSSAYVLFYRRQTD